MSYRWKDGERREWRCSICSLRRECTVMGTSGPVVFFMCDDCQDAAKNEWCKQRNGIGAIFLPPSLYDAAERLGYDMRQFIKQREIPDD